MRKLIIRTLSLIFVVQSITPLIDQGVSAEPKILPLTYSLGFGRSGNLTPEVFKKIVKSLKSNQNGTNKAVQLKISYKEGSKSTPFQVTLKSAHENDELIFKISPLKGTSQVIGSVSTNNDSVKAEIKNVRQDRGNQEPSGTQLVNLTTSFLKAIGTNEASLTDASIFQCPNSNSSYSLARCRILTHGLSWYSSLGYYPSNLDEKLFEQ